MANLLDRFNQISIGSSGTIYDYLPVITSSGDFKRIEGINVVLTSWQNILLTPLGTYDHDPTYGSLLYRYVHDPADSKTRGRIVYEIKNRLPLFEDRARIEKVSISFLGNRKGFITVIEVNYKGQEGELNTAVTDANISRFLGG